MRSKTITDKPKGKHQPTRVPARALREYKPSAVLPVPDASVSFVDAAPWLSRGPALRVFAELRKIAVDGDVNIQRKELAQRLRMSERNISRGISSLLEAHAIERYDQLNLTKYRIIANMAG